MNNGAARHTPGSGRSNPLLAQSHRLARASAWGTSYRRGRVAFAGNLASGSEADPMRGLRESVRAGAPTEGAALFAPEHTAQILPFPATSAQTRD